MPDNITATSPTPAPNATPAISPSPEPTGEGFIPSTAQPGGEPTTQPTTQPTGEVKPELIAGKYKSQDDLVKAHKELESKLGKLTALPESYDLDRTLGELGIGWANDDERSTTQAALKEAGLRQDQAEKLLPFYAQSVAKAVQSFGHVTDMSAETNTLKGEWQDNYDARVKEIAQFASTLPKELIHTPLQRSAAGMKLLYDLMSQKRGPELINDGSAASMTSLQARLDQIVSDPKYSDPGAQGQQLQTEACRIAERIAGSKK